ncbi:MAG: hypothetical protein IJZ23_04715 [Roseburia sp.]|nr:hypothetical protein [Roseburia sp.]
MKKYVGLIILIGLAVISVIVDAVIKSNWGAFNEINRVLFTLVSVMAGFWVTCYLLFLQIYKDRYPLKFLKNRYLPQMKSYLVYIIFCIVFGSFIIVKNGGVVENIYYGAVALGTVLIILKQIYNTSKTIMVNTYVDEFCEEISKQLDNNENGVTKGVFKDLRYVLDECIVKEEYYIAQNISIRLGEVFRDFLKNSIALIVNGEEKLEVEESFNRIANIGVYQLRLCNDINSELLVGEIIVQQIKNIECCINSEQYEWFKKYIHNMSILTFQAQKEGKNKVVESTFAVYTDVLEKLVEEEKEEWIKYLLDNLFSMTTSLNFLSRNINLKYFGSLLVYGLLKCKEGSVYEYIYKMFEEFTGVVCRVSNSFSDVKVYYALYFNNIVKNNNIMFLKRFFNTIFKYGQDSGNDTAWTEFKFYCIKEVLERKEEKIDIDVNSYHIKLLVEVIELKEQYDGYMFWPKFEEEINAVQSSKPEIEHICSDIRFLLNKCIINDNLNLFFMMIKKVNQCMLNTEAKNKDLQILLFRLFVWLIERTKRLNNKQFVEIAFIELDEILIELDKKRAISKDFGDLIVSDLTDLAKQSDSDSYDVVLQVIELFSGFLKENKELYFINNFPDRKEKLYRGVFNIATSCIENDFEEGVRRCSNTIGWYTIYSIKQSNVKLTKYLIRLAKGMLEISMDMNISTKTQTFLLTLFTTVGMYCCMQSMNYVYIDAILEAIQRADKNLVYTAIKIRTYENDMWDNLFDKKTQALATSFRKRYEEHQKKIAKN